MEKIKKVKSRSGWRKAFVILVIALSAASVQSPAQVESSSGWARTALIALALLAALGLGGAVAYRFLKGLRANRESRQAATV